MSKVSGLNSKVRFFSNIEVPLEKYPTKPNISPPGVHAPSTSPHTLTLNSGTGPTLLILVVVVLLNIYQVNTLYLCFISIDKDTPMLEYVDTRNGLYPAPLGRSAKANVITKVRQKFKFLGKLMAKALMDSRMVNNLVSFLKTQPNLYFRLICHLILYSINGY